MARAGPLHSKTGEFLDKDTDCQRTPAGLTRGVARLLKKVSGKDSGQNIDTKISSLIEAHRVNSPFCHLQ